MVTCMASAVLRMRYALLHMQDSKRGSRFQCITVIRYRLEPNFVYKRICFASTKLLSLNIVFFLYQSQTFEILLEYERKGNRRS